MNNIYTDWEFPYTTEEMEETFPDIVQDMKDCPQDPRYHGEGNVWEHTKLVLERMEDDPKLYKLLQTEQAILRAAVFCHDIAKPATTVIEGNQISSPKHAVLGAKMTRDLFWNPSAKNYFPAPWAIRETVANLVRLHMLPFYFIDKDYPTFNVCLSSYLVKNSNLAILGRADTSGRICQDNVNHQNGIETVKLFEEFCEEKHCLNNPAIFLSDNARFRYFFEHKGDPCLDYFEKIKGTVIIMAGLQGSGKDYAISKHYADLPMVGFDQMREELGLKFGKDEAAVQTALKEAIKVHMRKGDTFVFNATNLIKDVRSTWIRRFRRYGYRIKIHYVEKSLKETLKNNKSRDAVVPEGIIMEKFSRMDVPTLMECHELKLETKDAT